MGLVFKEFNCLKKLKKKKKEVLTQIHCTKHNDSNLRNIPKYNSQAEMDTQVLRGFPQGI